VCAAALSVIFCAGVGLTPPAAPPLIPPRVTHPNVAVALDIEYRPTAPGDIADHRSSRRHNSLDIYYPTMPESAPSTLMSSNGSRLTHSSRPVLFFVHGGGWKRGHSQSFPLLGLYSNLGRSFASRGFVVVIANYRKSSGPSVLVQALLVLAAGAVVLVLPERCLSVRATHGHPSRSGLPCRARSWGTRWAVLVVVLLGAYWIQHWIQLSRNARIVHPTHSIDVALALNWTTTSIGAYGGDTGRLVVVGHSAGAHILSMLLVEPALLREAVGGRAAELRVRDAVDAAVLVGGPYHGEVMQQSWVARFAVLHPVFGSVEALWGASFPVHHCQNTTVLNELRLPPVLLVSAERELPETQHADTIFLPLLTAGGVTAKHVGIPGSNHFDSVLLVGAYFSAAERILVGNIVNFTQLHVGGLN
jgi:acetyl esterase/lipase